jgi:DNA replication protein DnaC
LVQKSGNTKVAQNLDSMSAALLTAAVDRQNILCIDTKRLPSKAARQMRSLLDGGFLERTENVLVFGNPGGGKTHMLQAISQELVRRGHRMLFTSCEMLVQQLLTAKRDLKLSRSDPAIRALRRDHHR